MLLVTAGCAHFSRRCDVEDVRFGDPSSQFLVSNYHPSGDVQKSLLIIPPTGGTNLIDRSYAQTFCQKGYDVYIVNDWPREGENSIELDVHQKFYEHAQTAIRTVVDRIQTPFIGLIGTSVGALHAAIAANSIEKLNAVYFIAGGLPIIDVVVTSDQGAMQDLRAKRKSKFGFKSDKENIDAVEKIFRLEPSRMGNLHLQKDFGEVLGRRDTTVPYKTQLNLQELYRPRDVMTLENDHFWTIVKTWFFHTDHVVDFFEESARSHGTR